MVLGIITTACSEGPNESESPDLSQASQLGAERTIAEIETPTGSIKFQDLTGKDGIPSIGIAELSRITAGRTPLATKLEKHDATSLEIFMALSKEPPHEVLVDAHRLEAQALGRDDDSIVPVEIDVHALVDKVSTGTCSAYVQQMYEDQGYDGAHTLIYANNRTSGADYEKKNVTGYVYSGVCNDGNTTLTAVFYAAPWGEFYAPVFPLATINPGYLARYWYKKTTPGHPETKYLIRVSGQGKYHVRMYGYAYDVI